MLNIEQDKNLAEYTTMGVGGNAKYFIEIFDERGLIQAVEFAQEKGLQVFILGGGSNVIISDQGFAGLVILNRITGVDVDEPSGLVKGGAGENWDNVVEKVVAKGLSGIECLSGIPGTLGGAAVQNIGAYGQTFGDVIEKVEAFNVAEEAIEEFSLEKCEFDYRTSKFKNNPNYILTHVYFRLQKGKPKVSYHDIVEYFKLKNIEPTLPSVREATIKIRAGKGMVVLPEYEIYRSVGSFFTNPILEKMHFDKIYPELKFESPATPWHWDLPDGRVKISGAYLISKAGFPKGYKNGEVGISPRQNLSIINLEQAKASDIKALAETIKSEVYKRFGVILSEEVVYVGSF